MSPKIGQPKNKETSKSSKAGGDGRHLFSQTKLTLGYKKPRSIRDSHFA